MLGASKDKWRAEGRARAPVSEAERARSSQAICDLILSSPAFADARHVGIFYPRSWEVDLLALWRAEPAKSVFPRVGSDGASLVFHRIVSLSALRPGYGGIPAPEATRDKEVATWDETDLVLVPGLAFDTRGGRVGSGKGLYDRFLSGPGARARKWGVCWRAQLEREPLPQAAGDVLLDAVVTEAGKVACSAREGA